MLKWLRENGCSRQTNAMSFAVEGGHLEVMKWLKDDGCPLESFHAQNCSTRGIL